MKLEKQDFKVCNKCGCKMFLNGDDQLYQYLKFNFEDRMIKAYSCPQCGNYVIEISSKNS